MDNMNSNFDNTFENNTDTLYSDTGSTGKTGTAVKDGVTAIKDKVGEQAAGIKDKLSEQAKTYGTQLTQKIDGARGKTSAGLKTTSQRIQNLAMYVEEHDAKDMSQAVVRSSKELIRENPGKSLLVGMALGLLFGRIFSMGGHGHHQHHHR